MQARQKTFLYVAGPFALAAIGVWLFVSMAGGVVLTVAGLGVLTYLLTRPTGRTLAHSACAYCQRKIIFEHQGEICAACDQGVHGDCMGEHRMKAHAVVKEQPFR